MSIPLTAPSASARPAPAAPPPPPPPPRSAFADLLSESRILIWDEPLSRRDILRHLAGAIDGALAPVTPEFAVERMEAREAEGSTFLNEGVALPHARLKGLAAPQVALGITRAGVLDSPTANPIEVVFMLLTPDGNASTPLRLLAAAGRTLQDRSLRKALAAAATAADALRVLRGVP